MAEPDYTAISQRILDLLKADEQFAKVVSEFRFGELPEETAAHSYPACYVTTPPSPEVRRTALTTTDLGKMAGQRIETEFWIICVAREATSADTQKQLYAMRGHIYRILNVNTRLTSAGTDPLCNSLVLYTIGRLTRQRGQLVDGLNIRVRCYNTTDPS